MIMIKIILASIFFSFYFIEQARIPVKAHLEFKPFNCNICLSAWTALALYWLPVWVTDMVLVSFTAGVFAPLFRNFMYNVFFPKK